MTTTAEKELQMIQKQHDNAVELGARCSGTAPMENLWRGDGGGRLAKAHGEMSLAKLQETLAAKQQDLAKALAQLAGLREERAQLGASIAKKKQRIAELEAQPAAAKASLRVTKNGPGDGGDAPIDELDAQIAKAKTSEEKALLQIKKAHRAGARPIGDQHTRLN